MFKSILFTIAFIMPALTIQQSAQQSPVQTAQLHECGWFLCKPPVQTAQLHECGWFLCKPPVNATATAVTARVLV